MNISQAGALVATSLQQVFNKSVSEATPVLQEFWGSRAKSAPAATETAQVPWRPFSSAKGALEGGLSAVQAVQRRNSDAAEKKKAEEAIKLLQSQVGFHSIDHILISHQLLAAKRVIQQRSQLRLSQ